MSASDTPEARALQAAEAGRKGGRASRKVSPWNRGPMCDGPNAMAAFKRYQQNAPQRAARPSDK